MQWIRAYFVTRALQSYINRQQLLARDLSLFMSADGPPDLSPPFCFIIHDPLFVSHDVDWPAAWDIHRALPSMYHWNTVSTLAQALYQWTCNFNFTVPLQQWTCWELLGAYETAYLRRTIYHGLDCKGPVYCSMPKYWWHSSDNYAQARGFWLLGSPTCPSHAKKSTFMWIFLNVWAWSLWTSYSCH